MSRTGNLHLHSTATLVVTPAWAKCYEVSLLQKSQRAWCNRTRDFDARRLGRSWWRVAVRWRRHVAVRRQQRLKAAA